MFKFFKHNQAAKKLNKLIEQKQSLPSDVSEIISSIQATKPDLPRPQFKEALQKKLEAEHHKFLLANDDKNLVKQSMPILNADFWQNLLGGKKLVKGLSIAVLVVFISLIGLYPLIPAPQVKGAAKTEGVVKISYNAPIKITFTQPMDKSSVEKAFHIEPNIPGRFEWDRNVLKFYPKAPFKIDDQYKVTVDVTAQSLFFKNITAEYHEQFQIVASPKVTLFTPATGLTVDPENTKLTVMFDRPMTSLTSLDAGEKAPIFIDIQPAIEGRFKWLGTSSFQLIPTRLTAGTHYAVKIPAGTVAADGGSLEADYVTDFFTPEPIVQSLLPDNKNILNGPDTKVEINFNQPINLDSLNELGGLYRYKNSDQSKMAGFFSGPVDPNNKEAIAWLYDSNNWEKVSGQGRYKEKSDLPKIEPGSTVPEPTESELNKTVLFIAKNKIPLDSYYKFEIKAGVKGVEGDVGLKNPFASFFKTVGQPKLISSDPTNGQKDLNSWVINLRFNNPMDLDSLRQLIQVNPHDPAKAPDMYLTGNDTELVYYFDYKPSADFTITIPKDVKDKFGQVLGQDTVIKFTTAALPPDFSLLTAAPVNVLDLYHRPAFYVNSTNIHKLTLKVQPMPLAEFANFYKNGYFDLSNYSPGPDSIVLDKDVSGDLNKKVISDFDFNAIFNDLVKPGLYYVEVQSDEVKFPPYNQPKVEKTMFLLTYSSLAYKHAAGKILVWATDLKTGQPIQGMDIEVKRKQGMPGASAFEYALIANGKTDRSGLLEMAIPAEKDNDYWPDYSVTGRKGDDVTFVTTSWTQGIEVWNFGLDYQAIPDKYYGHIYTERPLYRPGQIVYFKGLVRQAQDAGFRMPDQKEVTLEILDSNAQEIYKKKIPISPNGSFSGDLTLSKDARLGSYSMNAYFESQPDYNRQRFYQSFAVAEYRKPDFKLATNAEKSEYINGETAKINIAGSYYFGSPMPDRPYTYAVTATDYYFNKADGEWYSFSDDGNLCFWGCQGGSSIVTEGRGTLDSNGHGQISLPLEIMDKKVSQLYTIETTVTDLNNQTVSDRASIAIHKGEYYVGIRTDDYVAKTGQPLTFKIISVDPKGTAVADKNLFVTFFKRDWNTVSKKNVDGSYYFENTFNDTQIERKAGKTNNKGQAEISFTPPSGGMFRAVVESKDSRGNLITAASSIYVSAREFINWGRENNDRLELVADKPEYKIGDTAKILIKSPYANVKALLTYERQQVVEKKIIDIVSNSQTIEIPITESFLPNTFASVVIVKGGGEDTEYKASLSNVVLEKNNQLIASKTQKIKDNQAQIDKNFGLYENSDVREAMDKPLKDENIKLQQEIDGLKKEVEDAKNLSQSPLKKIDPTDEKNIAGFKVGYINLPIDTKHKQLKIELNLDKASYHPGEEVSLKIKTSDLAGQARPSELSLSVVDESLLALTDNYLADLLSIFYRKRAVGVLTTHTLTQSLARINVQAALGQKGGSGGLDPKRKDFKDVAFWQAVVQTDAKGEATVKFKAPDNLTSWQILSLGITQDTLVGSQTKSFTVNQDIMIRPVLPRFLITNDELKIGAIVHNNTTLPLDAKVVLPNNPRRQDLMVEDSVEKSIHVDPGSEQKVEWKIKVGRFDTLIDGLQGFKFFVTKGDLSAGNILDSLEMKLPTYSFSVPETVATAGIISDDQGYIERLRIPSDVDQTLGKLTIKLAPTLISTIADGIDDLVRYPYGCTEQTVSSLLPNLVVKQLINLPAFKNPKIDLKDLDKKVDSGLQRIYSFQNGNGGFGLWDTSEPTPYLTSYVLFALNEAKKAGYHVDDNVFNRAKDFLLNHIKEHPLQSVESSVENYHQANVRAYALYALAEIGAGDIGLTNNLYDLKSNLSLASQAYLVMTYQSLLAQGLGDSAKATIYGRIKGLIDEILVHQKVTPRGLHFEETKLDRWLFDTNTRSTAIILKAIMATDIKHPVVGKVIRHMLSEKRPGYFLSTQDKVTTLLSLIDFLKKSNELNPDLKASIELNHEKIVDGGEAYFNKDNLSTTVEVTKGINELLLNDQDNEVKITHVGTGNLYYDMTLKYYLPLEKVEARDEGLQLTQEYFATNDKKAENPLVKLTVGQNYKAKITLLVPEDRYYVAVDDALPAGLEAIDFNLKTSQQLMQSRNEAMPRSDGDWQPDYFNHKEFRDDRAVFFADFLPKGVYEIEYFVRATSEGTFHDLPTIGYEMYFPEVFGRTGGRMLEITGM